MDGGGEKARPKKSEDLETFDGTGGGVEMGGALELGLESGFG